MSGLQFWFFFNCPFQTVIFQFSLWVRMFPLSSLRLVSKSVCLLHTAHEEPFVMLWSLFLYGFRRTLCPKWLSKAGSYETTPWQSHCKGCSQTLPHSTSSFSGSWPLDADWAPSLPQPCVSHSLWFPVISFASVPPELCCSGPWLLP